MYILKNWAIQEHRSTAKDKYLAPELRVFILKGYVYNHPEYPDHHKITTSVIAHLDVLTRIAITKSAHRYKLEKPSRDYKEFIEKNNPDWKYRQLLEWSDDK